MLNCKWPRVQKQHFLTFAVTGAATLTTYSALGTWSKASTLHVAKDAGRAALPCTLQMLQWQSLSVHCHTSTPQKPQTLKLNDGWYISLFYPNTNTNATLSRGKQINTNVGGSEGGRHKERAKAITKCSMLFYASATARPPPEWDTTRGSSHFYGPTCGP